MENKPADKNNELKPDLFEDQPAPAQSFPADKAARAEKPGAEVKPVTPVKEAPKGSRAGRFFRRLLWWALLLAAFFVAGMAVTYFGIYRPELARLQAEAADAEGLLSVLNDEKTALEARVAELEPAGAENEQFSMHNAVLAVMNDVFSAHLALAAEDPAAAQISLNKTSDVLAEIKGKLEPAQQQVITDLETRLENTVSIMERDPDAALLDFQIIESNLIKLENDLFLP